MIFEHHSNLKYKFGSKTFWTMGYYASTVGLNEATIKKYKGVRNRRFIFKENY